jgi:hypothetical protein
MRCDRIEELLGASLTDALDAAEERELREHLAVCPGCAEEARGLRETWKILDAWEAEEPPPLLTEAVKAEIVRDLGARGGFRRGGTGRLLGAAALGVALAVAAVLVLPGRASLAEVPPALLLSCAAFWAGVFVFASLLALRPAGERGSAWRTVGLAGLLALGGSMLLARSCDVVTLVRACARSRWCGAVLEGLGVESGYFVAGALYAALPLTVALLLVRGGASLRPVPQGLIAGGLLFALLVPAILLQCVPFTWGLVASWLGGALFGSLLAGAAGPWAAARIGWVQAGRR